MASGWFRRVVLGLDSRSAGTAPRLPSRTTSGDVTVASALTLPAVYRGIQILATTGAQLARDLIVTRGDEQVTPTPAIIRRPDVNRSASSFVKRYIVGMASTGNAYLRHIRNPFNNAVDSVELLNPLTTTPYYDDHGRKVYDAVVNGRLVTLKDSEVTHLRLLEVPGMIVGLGPIQANRAGLAGALDLRAYADNVFRDGKVPSGVLSSSAQLDKIKADAMRERFHESIEGGQVAVLGHGMTYEAVMLKPIDAQWLESQQFSVTDIARIFGIPASYMLAEVNGSSLTYSNLEQVDTQFVRTTLLAYLVELEDALTDLLPRGQEVRFRTDSLLRADSKTRAEIHKTYLDAGVLSPATVARLEGLPTPPPAKPAPAPISKDVDA